MSVPPWGGDIIAECLSSLHEGARSVAVESLRLGPIRSGTGNCKWRLSGAGTDNAAHSSDAD